MNELINAFGIILIFPGEYVLGFLGITSIAWITIFNIIFWIIMYAGFSQEIIIEYKKKLSRNINKVI